MGPTITMAHKETWTVRMPNSKGTKIDYTICFPNTQAKKPQNIHSIMSNHYEIPLNKAEMLYTLHNSKSSD